MAALTNRADLNLRERCRINHVVIDSVSAFEDMWAAWKRAVSELRAATGEPDFPAFENPRPDPFVEHLIIQVLSGPWMFVRYHEERSRYEAFVRARATLSVWSHHHGFRVRVLPLDGAAAVTRQLAVAYGAAHWRIHGALHLVGFGQEEYNGYFPACVRSHIDQIFPDAAKEFFQRQWVRLKNNDDELQSALRRPAHRVFSFFYPQQEPAVVVPGRVHRRENASEQMQNFIRRQRRRTGNREPIQTDGVQSTEEKERICKPFACKNHWRSLTDKDARQCPICFENTTERTHKMISCGHFVCVICIANSLFDWKCPVCRASITEKEFTFNE